MSPNPKGGRHNYPKNGIMWFYHRVMHPIYADGMANSVDPDQTVPDLTV